MANSFNISVKPEIAAVKADTADIRTDVTAIHDTALPAVKTDTDDIRTDVTAIHDTNLPAVKTDTDDIRTDVTAIHDTNLPAVKTDTGNILTNVATIDGIVDEILLDTDALPQNVRGKLYTTRLVTTNAAFQEVVNVSGHGKIVGIGLIIADAGDTIQVKLTLDGLLFGVLSHTGDVLDHSIVFNCIAVISPVMVLLDCPPTNYHQFDVEFETSFLLECCRSDGIGGNVIVGTSYLLDSF